MYICLDVNIWINMCMCTWIAVESPTGDNMHIKKWVEKMKSDNAHHFMYIPCKGIVMLCLKSLAKFDADEFAHDFDQSTGLTNTNFYMDSNVTEYLLKRYVQYASHPQTCYANDSYFNRQCVELLFFQSSTRPYIEPDAKFTISYPELNYLDTVTSLSCFIDRHMYLYNRTKNWDRIYIAKCIMNTYNAVLVERVPTSLEVMECEKLSNAQFIIVLHTYKGDELPLLEYERVPTYSGKVLIILANETVQETEYKDASNVYLPSLNQKLYDTFSIHRLDDINYARNYSTLTRAGIDMARFVNEHCDLTDAKQTYYWLLNEYEKLQLPYMNDTEIEYDLDISARRVHSKRIKQFYITIGLVQGSKEREAYPKCIRWAFERKT